ncbi:MAG: D-amino-acid oxidase [Gammaproteobacteria bacterium]|nr:MAG: D-amino-acid oxidase [Gammaproteobacteria bacterium]
MDRRTFAKLLSSALIARSSGLRALMNGNRIVVVGAGIVGSSIAYHLTKMGAEVTVIERDRPAAHASGKSFAWINASYPKKPYSYHHLSRLSLLAYHRLETEIGIDVHWGGSLEWFTSPENQKMLTQEIKIQQDYGVPIEMISDEKAKELEPNVKFDKNAKIAFSQIDGAVDAVKLVDRFLSKTVSLGGDVFHPVTYEGLKTIGQKIVAIKTSVGEIEADQVVFACGVDTDDLLKIDVLKMSKPGIILRTQPMKKVIDRVIVAPGVHIHQQNDGTVIIGEQTGAPMSHLERLDLKPESFPSAAFEIQHSERILAIAQQFVPQLEAIELEEVVIGWRPLPHDERPVVGHVKNIPGTYLATMHSGVTLAPIIGELVAMELLDGTETNLLADFRPDRFI